MSRLGELERRRLDGRKARRVEQGGEHEQVAAQVIARKQIALEDAPRKDHLVRQPEFFGKRRKFVFIRSVADDDKAEVQPARLDDLQRAQHEVDTLVLHDAPDGEQDVLLPREGVFFVDLGDQRFRVGGVGEVGPVADDLDLLFISVGAGARPLRLRKR